MSLNPVTTAQDVDKAAEKVTQAIRRGDDITPADGERMMGIFESRIRVIESVQLESRIEKLEEKIAADDRPRAA